MFRQCILFIVAIPLLAVGNLAQSGRHVAAPAARKRLIGYLQKEQYADKYGCTYSISSDRARVIFFDQEISGGAEALMNIDGKDVQLKYAGISPPLEGRPRVGRREVLNYAAPGIKVRVIRSIGKEVGSGFNYSGTITVTRNDRVQTVRFTGWCGA